MVLIRTSILILWWWWKSETWTCESLSLPPGQEVCNGPVCQSRWWWFRSWDHLCWCHCDIIDCTLKRHLRVEQQMRAPLRENPQSLPIMISRPLLSIITNVAHLHSIKTIVAHHNTNTIVAHHDIIATIIKVPSKFVTIIWSYQSKSETLVISPQV